MQDVLSPIALRLDDGQVVRIPDVLPDGLDRHPVSLGSYWSRVAIKRLRDWTRNRPMVIKPENPASDRHGRLRAAVFVLEGTAAGGPTGGPAGGPEEGAEEAEDLALRLCGEGLVRVFAEPGADSARISMLLAAEKKARDQNRGAWGDGTFSVKAEDLEALPSDRFDIIAGTVQRVSRIGRRHHLEFGEMWRTDLTLGLNPPIVRALNKEGIAPEGLVGLQIQARGWLRPWNGPFIEMDRRDHLSISNI